MCEHAALWKESHFRLENRVWARSPVQWIPFQVRKQCVGTQPCERNPLLGWKAMCEHVDLWKESPFRLESNVLARSPVKGIPFEVGKQSVSTQPCAMNPLSAWKSICKRTAPWKESLFRLESNVWARSPVKGIPFQIGKQCVSTQPCERNPVWGWETICERAAMWKESPFSLESNLWARSPENGIPL